MLRLPLRPVLEPLLLVLEPLTVTFPFSYLSLPRALQFTCREKFRNPQARSEASLDNMTYE